MKTLFHSCIDVKKVNHDSWESAANFVINEIFTFNEQCGSDTVLETISIIDNYIKHNPYVNPSILTSSDDHIDLLKSLINFFIENKLNMIDPINMMDFESEESINDSIQINQIWFLLLSHCSMKLFDELLFSLQYLNKTNVNMSKETISSIVIRKHHDYGPENISKFGTFGIAIRLHDKIARLENLLSSKRNGKNSVSDESIYDTLVDIVGYSIVGLLWINNWFLLPMEVDHE